MGSTHQSTDKSPVNTTIDEMASELHSLAKESDERVMVGICGPPGAGKSWVADGIARTLGPDVAVVVPFDGFHLSTEIIGNTPLMSRRGAVDTFDLGSYKSLIERLRARDEDVVYAPMFKRGLEEPIASAIAIPREVPVVITEGNYLLTPHPILRTVRALLDAVWYLHTPPAVRLPQLVARHVAFGKNASDAEEWARGSDQRNADEIESTRQWADRIISVSNEVHD